MSVKPPGEFTILDNLRGFDLQFKTSWGLFSHQKVDEGSRLLVEAVEIWKGDKCLDLGCGWGLVGVVMGKLNPEGEVWFTDRDVAAIQYSSMNCQLNGVANARFNLGNGLVGIEERFNVVASNLPTHVANDMVEWLIEGAKEALGNEGKLYVVTVSKLKPFIERTMEKVFGNYRLVSKNKLYSVSMAYK